MGLFSALFGGEESKTTYTTPFQQLSPQQQAAFLQAVWNPAVSMPWYRPISYGGEDYVLPNLTKSQALNSAMPMMGNLVGSTTQGSPSPFASMLATAASVLPFVTSPTAIPYTPISTSSYPSLTALSRGM